MNRIMVVVGLGLLLSATSALAQSSGPSGGTASPDGSTVQPGGQFGRTISASEFNKLQDYADQSKRLTKDEKDKGKTLEDLLAEDKAAATTLAKEMSLGCQVDQAILAAQGPVTEDGKTIQTKTYEAACSNGMGYFLVSQDPGKPFGISCFAADATRIADIAAGRPPGVVCRLPANADPKTMASSLMSHGGTACTVRDYRWAGQSKSAHIDFNEVACADNAGYMLLVPMPGSTAQVHISSCRDSALRGLPCKLSDNGGAVITKQTFKDALQKHAIVCDAGENDIHAFGQETIQKRYVVEFKCTQQSAGLVTYIPLADAKAPFEAIDCAAAAKRGVKCTLTAPK